LGLSQQAFYLLSVASKLEYERKNIGILLEALDLIQNPAIELLALGKAGSEFKNQYPSIKYFGSDYDPFKLRTLYSAADVFVIPSLVDNLPNTVLESLFCGTAVVGADVGGIPEMVVPGETGWLFDPRDPRSLAEILSQIYQERELLSRMKVRCRSWVQDRFSIENQRDQYLELFQTMVDDKLGN
jgi:glycosyltransferase involved in cell wall biosynthesis